VISYFPVFQSETSIYEDSISLPVFSFNEKQLTLSPPFILLFPFLSIAFTTKLDFDPALTVVFIPGPVA